MARVPICLPSKLFIWNVTWRDLAEDQRRALRAGELFPIKFPFHA